MKVDRVISADTPNNQKYLRLKKILRKKSEHLIPYPTNIRQKNNCWVKLICSINSDADSEGGKNTADPHTSLFTETSAIKHSKTSN